jgi:hypothetical protein
LARDSQPCLIFGGAQQPFPHHIPEPPQTSKQSI